jgi:hypothetical protein
MKQPQKVEAETRVVRNHPLQLQLTQIAKAKIFKAHANLHKV